MKISFLFKWFDMWVGFFWDSKKKWLYILPIPMFGIILKFRPICWGCKKRMKEREMRSKFQQGYLIGLLMGTVIWIIVFVEIINNYYQPK